MKKYHLLLGLCFAALLSCQQKNQKTASKENPLQYVDPMIGTGFHGHTFPGAVVPSGMVQLSPDTRINGWDACSGYHHSDSTILGFSHTHLSGTGIGDMGDFLVLPYTGSEKEKMLAFYQKKNQTASPGYYRVKMDNGVLAELTTTTRAGIHRYSFPENEDRKVLFDISHVLQITWGGRNLNAQAELVDEYTIKGSRISTGWAADDRMHFYARFS
ncbi:MAG: glycoside hydrolase family 92 protein, partial [Cytophagales bacterium]|nr:glycoside hydrolase family 92 protein [Cytophagales bacterium]